MQVSKSKTEEEILEGVPEEQPEPTFKKVRVILLAFFLLTIFLVYIITLAGNNFLASLIESSIVKENKIDFSLNGKVVFLNGSLEKLQDLWVINPEIEFKVCLQGQEQGGTYYIDAVYTPKTYSQSVSQVRAEPCSEDSLIDLHSHPLRHCLPSEQDFKTFKQFKERRPLALMAIMCEPTRFTIYENI